MSDMRVEAPDAIKITPAEASQLLSGRVKRLQGVGIGDEQTCLQSAKILWPKLCAWSATQTAEVAK